MATGFAEVEVWRPVAGWDRFYEVSNLGRVRSLDRIVRRGKGTDTQKGRILQPQKNSRGYLQVALCKDGKKKRVLVHRLVAAAFCHQPDGCNLVNHIDCNQENNRADNLEWTTALGNTRHAILQQRMTARAVIRGDNKIYPIMRMVEEDGYSRSSVCRCCRGELKTHKGEKWRYYAGIGDGIHGGKEVAGYGE